MAPSEVLFDVSGDDPFFQAHGDSAVHAAIAERLDRLTPTIFHFHHFWNVGTDLIMFLRRRYPDTVFMLTLHEYLAICYRDGQMLRQRDDALCSSSAEESCIQCFPAISSEMFRARRSYFLQLFSAFDTILSPSEFLVERYREWGLRARIEVVENGIERPPAEPTLEDAKLTRRFAFFRTARARTRGLTCSCWLPRRALNAS
ncbi:glycosyltransferase [Micromonospora sp. STR1s_5]|nr:glycosyltransferase [Micromonospora sp. STR1s_5]